MDTLERHGGWWMVCRDEQSHESMQEDAWSVMYEDGGDSEGNCGKLSPC